MATELSIDQKAALENPLTNADYKKINDALYKINRFVNYCTRAENAGVDCGDRLEVAEYLRTQLEKRKKAFFPGKP